MRATLTAHIKDPKSYALTFVRKMYKVEMDIINTNDEGALVVFSGSKRMLKKLAHHPAGLFDAGLANMIEEV